ncbi:MAG: hypothetical protein JJU12_00410 [Chlamydiales bacterium]|nr:hypothetical protein [Chlamydiales bacterium]
MEEHTFLNFLSKHWSKLLLGFLAIASIAAWGERFLSSNKSQSNQDFILANQIFERFRSGETLPVESIEATEMILKRHPELHPKYDTMLAMTYLAQRNPKGLFYAKAPLEHSAQQISPFHKSYAKTSLLIAEKKYQEAYNTAQDLHRELKNNQAYSTLSALNLLRLISLEKEIGVRSEAWEELKAHPTYPTISSLFREGALSLEDWYALRLKN